MSLLNTIKSPLFLVVLVIIFFQYRKIGKLEKEVLGVNTSSILFNTLISTFFGLLGGLIGSIIFIHFKITINPEDFYFILPLALGLSLIHPRFICFSYAGGIITLISLIFNYPNINIPGILMIIGVLHLVESFLILIDGNRMSIPIFMERKGQIVGGFMLNRFWPVPFTVFINGNNIYLATIIAVLGYGDYALTNYPEKKSKETAAILSIFSITLIVFAKLSVYHTIFKYIGAIFSPLGHEIVIKIGRKKEESGEYIFKSVSHGVKVLDTLPDSIGKAMNLKPGDIILSLNGNRVYSNWDIADILEYRPNYIGMEIIQREEGIITKEFEDYKNGISNLGIITVSDMCQYGFVVEEAKSPISRFLKKIKKRKAKFRN